MGFGFRRSADRKQQVEDFARSAWRSRLSFAAVLSLLMPIALVSVAPSFGQARQPNEVPEIIQPAFPEIRLGINEAAGQRAIDLLGAKFPEVAAWYGHTPQEFRAMLLNDKTLRIDKNGRLFVVEELKAPLVAPAYDPETGIIDGATVPLDQTFLLHSRPGAKRTIVLNFRGATLSGTAWNSTGTPIVAPPYDLDGTTASFTDAELTRIQYIWHRVAEDFAPFDVNVTTELVPQDLITRSGTSDDVYGTVALVTTAAGVYNCSCGGVAYVGIFNATSDYNKPALVFYDKLSSGNEKYVAEAISHEVGHNIGLSHDGTSTTGYYQGHGSGVTGWAPIMGVGYYRSLSQWSKGEYLDANQKQDDYVVAQSRGLPLRADDFGGTLATATALQGTTVSNVTSSAIEGVIERPGDSDLFIIAAGAGPATFAIKPANRSPDADLVLRLLDSNGSEITSNNPLDLLNATISYNLPSTGTYYLEVKGTGKGDPLTTGYSDYGSLGLYRLTASYTESGVSVPVASFSLSPTTGVAPLQVTMTAANTQDALTYDWSFGDGRTAVNSAATTNYTYGTAGNYIVSLKVTNSAGLSSSASQTLTVTAPAVVKYVTVGNISLVLNISKKATTATATVRVTDDKGTALSAASVSGRWSGIVSSGTSTASTNTAGNAAFNSPRTTATTGTFTFTVTGVSLAGYTYDASKNAETSDGIARGALAGSQALSE